MNNIIEKKRSWGVTAVGIFIIIISILAIPVQFPYFITTFQQPIEKEIKVDTEISTTLSLGTREMRIAAMRRIVYAIVFLISGIGIIKRKNWGRLLFMTMIAIIFLLNLVDIILHRPILDKIISSIRIYSLLLFITVTSLFYFTRPKVKEQFYLAKSSLK